MALSKRPRTRWARLVTAASNRRFAKASPEQKRVTIARDVIAQIKANILTPRHGVYLCSDDVFPVSTSSARASVQISDVVVRTDNCNVCALGALFVCNVARADAMTMGQWTGCDSMFRYLDALFDLRQRQLIEMAFESWYGPLRQNYYGTNYNYYGSSVSREDGGRAFGPTERLVLIMKDIVEGDGTFDPIRFNKTVEGILEKKLKTKDPHAQL